MSKGSRKKFGAESDYTAVNDSLDDLAFAAAYGRQSIVAALLERERHDVNARSGVFGGTTPIMLAALGNYAEIVRMLAEAGAEVDARDGIGTTPLMRAASLGFVEALAALIEWGADPNAQDNSGGTPLMWGVMSHKLEILERLLKAGADVSAKDNRGETAIDRALLAAPKIFAIGGFEFSSAKRDPDNAMRELLQNWKK